MAVWRLSVPRPVSWRAFARRRATSLQSNVEASCPIGAGARLNLAPSLGLKGSAVRRLSRLFCCAGRTLARPKELPPAVWRSASVCVRSSLFASCLAFGVRASLRPQSGSRSASWAWPVCVEAGHSSRPAQPSVATTRTSIRLPFGRSIATTSPSLNPWPRRVSTSPLTMISPALTSSAASAPLPAREANLTNCPSLIGRLT